MDTRLAWFEHLYDAHADAVFRHLYFRLGDRERAKELTQDVFLKVWDYAAQGKVITHEKAFLYRIARNLFINDIRTDKHTASLEQLTDAGFEARATADDPLRDAEHAELLDHLATLKDTYRQVLTFRYLDGMSVKEIAELLDEGETTISMRIARAIEALKERYNQTAT